MKTGVYSLKQSEKQRRPYYIHLPKKAEKKYFYGKFNIVEQGMALWSSNSTVRSSEPFIIEVTMNGKTKQIKSKKDKV
jgi:hypothetical protein